MKDDKVSFGVRTVPLGQDKIFHVGGMGGGLQRVKLKKHINELNNFSLLMLDCDTLSFFLSELIVF